jgi:adenylate cyclase
MTLHDRRDQGRTRQTKRQASRHRAAAPRPPTWRTYLGITGLLVLLVVALVGGIIWFNAQKTQELMVAEAERLMIETGEKVTERLRLLYDPIYAIVGLGTQVSNLTAPLPPDGPDGPPDGPYPALKLMLRGLRIYPQIQSFYVGYENGDFYMVTHLAGEGAGKLRAALDAPPKAAFANEIITTSTNGQRVVRWDYLAEDGSVIGTSKPEPAGFDPRQRPWYETAKNSDDVEHSGLYIFASSGEPGFTLSRRFGDPIKGVIGADLAARQISQFLREQRITPSSTAFIFTTSGEVVAMPDESEMAAITKSVQPNTMISLPKIADMGNPLLSQVFASPRTARTEIYDVNGRSYVGRVIEIPPRYGENQLLAVMVPLDEIGKPVIEARNEALFRSIVILLLVLPLYATLIIGWIDRRLGRRAAADDDD